MNQTGNKSLRNLFRKQNIDHRWTYTVKLSVRWFCVLIGVIEKLTKRWYDQKRCVLLFQVWNKKCALSLFVTYMVLIEPSLFYNYNLFPHTFLITLLLSERFKKIWQCQMHNFKKIVKTETGIANRITFTSLDRKIIMHVLSSTSTFLSHKNNCQLGGSWLLFWIYAMSYAV